MSTTTKEKLKQLRATFKSLREEQTKLAKQFFKEESQKLFEENPDLKSFSWSQYTPYFNDGEECVFEARTDYPTINSVEDSYDLQTEEEQKSFDELQEKICKFLKNFNDDDFEAMFGDHCEVIVTKNKVEVEDYEHD